MTNKTISVRVHVNLEDIESLLYSAAQGTDYWTNSEPNDENEISGLGLLAFENEVKDFMKGDLVIYVFDGEDDDKKYELDIKRIKGGLTAMAKNERDHFTNLITDNADMYTADALIQCALFGKTIYS